MLRKSIGIYFLFLVLTLFLLPANLYAIPFTGDAWLANHNGTDEYYVVFDADDLPDVPTAVKMKRFKFKSDKPTTDFRDLVSDAVAFEVDNGLSKKIKKWTKKAGKKDLDPTEFINDKLAAKLFKVKFMDADGNKYKAKIAFAGFNNPFDEGEASKSVPEPAVLILLGGSLLGLGALRRFRKN